MLNFEKSVDGEIDGCSTRGAREGGRLSTGENERERAIAPPAPSLHLVPLIWRPLIPPNTRQTPRASALAQSPALARQMRVRPRARAEYTLRSLARLPSSLCLFVSILRARVHSMPVCGSCLIPGSRL